MANPRFTDENGNFGYTWAELPIVPSDRPDITSPVNTDRALIEYAQAGIIRQTLFLTERGRWRIQFSAITQAMVLSLQFFFGRAFIRFIPDADALGTYKEVYISNQFRPAWQPGGRYDLTLELRQYSP